MNYWQSSGHNKRLGTVKSLTRLLPPPLDFFLQGTTMMTYTSYPGFSPHTVLEWGTYDKVVDLLEMKAASPVPFMDAVRNATGGWIRSVSRVWA